MARLCWTCRSTLQGIGKTIPTRLPSRRSTIELDDGRKKHNVPETHAHHQHMGTLKNSVDEYRYVCTRIWLRLPEWDILQDVSQPVTVSCGVVWTNRQIPHLAHDEVSRHAHPPGFCTSPEHRSIGSAMEDSMVSTCPEYCPDSST
jgi:hypothetical protein